MCVYLSKISKRLTMNLTNILVSAIFPSIISASVPKIPYCSGAILFFFQIKTIIVLTSQTNYMVKYVHNYRGEKDPVHPTDDVIWLDDPCCSGQQWGRLGTKLTSSAAAQGWCMNCMSEITFCGKKITRTTKNPRVVVTIAWNHQTNPGVKQDRWSPKDKQRWFDPPWHHT